MDRRCESRRLDATVILREKCLRRRTRLARVQPAPQRFFFCPPLFLSLFLSPLSLSFSLLLSPSLPPSPSTLFARINSAVQNYRVLRRTVPRKWRPRKGRRFLLVIKIYAGTTWTPGWRRAFSNEEYDEGNYVDGKMHRI